MLPLYNVIHESMNAENGIFYNNFNNLLHGKILPCLSMNSDDSWTFMDRNFHALTPCNHYKKWRFMGYGRLIHYL